MMLYNAGGPNIQFDKLFKTYCYIRLYIAAIEYNMMYTVMHVFGMIYPLFCFQPFCSIFNDDNII